MKFDGEIVKFNVYDGISHPSKILSVNGLDKIDSLVEETFESIYEDKSEFIFDDHEFVNELLSLSNTKLLTSVVQALDLELKPLLEHLKYAFLGKDHIVSAKGIEVNKAKTDIIKSLRYPSTVRKIRSFFGYAGFYWRFIKNFSKVVEPLCELLQKDKKFEFGPKCKEAFDTLKQKLVSTPIIQSPD
ncbi:uncharacterized mitochondrial protein AtMg00860-like [Gossypium arboreum]|uniref:uncharacterized mitochondrial protein AtMg00860-like n=1 Tax=Gossypium arboreum TaxID=29729 RepID=UPI0008195DF6|nr:uncharacterized mitochondrial protein AtMg00860-like [Gossypium arboreum]